MRDTDKAAALQRLKSIQGHIGGIIRMVDDDAYCIGVLQQVQAVQGALDRVADVILEGHMSTCMVTAVRGDDPAQREQVLDEIVDVFRARRRT